jgi:hypothetical protein
MYIGRVNQSPSHPAPHKVVFLRSLGSLIVAMCFVEIALIGFLGRAGYPDFDFNYFYVAGKSLLAHQSPYDIASYANLFRRYGLRFNGDPFVYPPQFALFRITAALLDHRLAAFFLQGINLIATFALAAVTVLFVTKALVRRLTSSMELTKWALPILILAFPYTSLMIELGSITNIIVLLCCSAWYFSSRRSDVAAGLCLGLATVKPHYVLFITLYLLLERRWRLIGTASLISLLLFYLSSFFITPLIGVTGWWTAASSYANSELNRPGSRWVMGIPSMLSAVGVHVPSQSQLYALGLIMVAVLWLTRRCLQRDDILAVLVLIQFSLYAKYDEMIFLAPVLVS